MEQSKFNIPAWCKSSRNYMKMMTFRFNITSICCCIITRVTNLKLTMTWNISIKAEWNRSLISPPSMSHSHPLDVLLLVLGTRCSDGWSRKDASSGTLSTSSVGSWEMVSAPNCSFSMRLNLSISDAGSVKMFLKKIERHRKMHP